MYASSNTDETDPNPPQPPTLKDQSTDRICVAGGANPPRWHNMLHRFLLTDSSSLLSRCSFVQSDAGNVHVLQQTGERERERVFFKWAKAEIASGKTTLSTELASREAVVLLFCRYKALQESCMVACIHKYCLYRAFTSRCPPKRADAKKRAAFSQRNVSALVLLKLRPHRRC